MSSVVQIFVAAKRGAPMSAEQSAEAVTEGGLRGDRSGEPKNRRSPDYQVTFIEMENIEAFVQATGLPLTADMPRRNIITRGIRLNELCGKRFRVGHARFEGLELCEPCNLFAKRTHREVLQFFVGKGGLRARIVLGGEIRVGDEIEMDA
jgi:MOSC domain-containing protein YiiM